jgi:hypothetical protein
VLFTTTHTATIATYVSTPPTSIMVATKAKGIKV